MTIIAATDLSESSRAVAELAADVARARQEPLLVAHVVDGPILPGVRERLLAEERRLAARGCRTEVVLESGRVPDRLAGLAERTAANLVVVGAQGEGLRTLLGTVATAILHRVAAPLLVVRQPARLAAFTGAAREGAGRRLHALFCLSLDETEPPLREALAFLASVGGVDADLAHYRLVPEQPALRHDAVRLAARDAVEALGPLPPGVVATPIVRDGFGRLDAHVSDLATERDVDLIVCGSHRRHGLERVTEGSVAEGIVRHAPVSVLVARAPRGDA